MINPIDKALNHITMYRLVLYYVAGLMAVAFLGSFVSLAPVDPAQLAFSAVIITATCWVTNKAFALIYRVPVNVESVYITAFILVLLMPPPGSADHAAILGLVVASVAAIASKFLISVRRKHVFNPVAVGAVAAAYLVGQPATWWVDGNLLLLACVLAGGLLVVRKVQRFDMVGAYVLANVVVTLATTPPDMYGDALRFSVIYSPLLFAGFAMLTEPLTAPQEKWPRLAYGIIVGALSSPNAHVGSFYLTPEVAFLAGNLFAFAVAPRGRFMLVLQRIEKTASGSYDFVFRSDRKIRFSPGQYLNWTLPVPAPDSRGNRRPFTIASSPGEDEVRLGVKFHPRPSTFKRALAQLRPGDSIFADQVSGGFTLPDRREEKLVFIAGGIGVTPFRSMIQHMLDHNERRSVVVLYGNNRADEISYSDVLDRAHARLGVRTVYALAEADERVRVHHIGFMNRELIEREVPDYKERTFYISGPHAMVTHHRGMLRELGVRRSQIKVDYFPGFA